MVAVPNHNARNSDHVDGYYSRKYLLDLMETRGYSLRTVAKRARRSKTTVAEALAGDCKKIETLWDITVALDGDWLEVFKVKRRPASRVRRAVLNVGSDSVR